MRKLTWYEWAIIIIMVLTLVVGAIQIFKSNENRASNGGDLIIRAGDGGTNGSNGGDINLGPGTYKAGDGGDVNS